MITIMVMINIMKMEIADDENYNVTDNKELLFLIIRNGPSYDYQILSFLYRKNEPFVVVAGIS